MNRQISFTEHAGTWELKCTLPEGAEGDLVQITAPEKTVLTVSRGEMLTALIHTRWNHASRNFGENSEFSFTLTSPVTSGEVRICWCGYSFRLYVNGKLMDEDWPLGEPADGDWTLSASDCVSSANLLPCSSFEEDPEETYTEPFQNFVLPGHNTGVGDCMPFARDGRYCLFYLFDRRMHASKKGLGAHQWAQISSSA